MLFTFYSSLRMLIANFLGQKWWTAKLVTFCKYEAKIARPMTPYCNQDHLNSLETFQANTWQYSMFSFKVAPKVSTKRSYVRLCEFPRTNLWNNPFHVLPALLLISPVCVVEPQTVLAPLCFASVWHPSSQLRNGGCAHSRPPGQTYIVFTKTTSGFGQKWLSALFGATFLDPDVSYTGSCPETKPQGSRVPENDNLTKQKRMELIKHLTKSNATKNIK